MARLFCDIDDTLILWEKVAQVDGTYLGQPYTINEELVSNLRRFRAVNRWSLIILWSGGGKEYAQMWADRLNLRLAVCMTKDKTTFPLIEEDSIVIDDEDLGGLRTHKPDEWPEDAEAFRQFVADVAEGMLDYPVKSKLEENTFYGREEKSNETTNDGEGEEDCRA